MQKDPWSVSKLSSYIKNLLENDWQLNDVLIKGEISNFVHHRSGHMYLSVKDDKSVIKAVMFAGNNRTLQFIPKNGMSVLIKGYISLYERDGQYQLYIQEMYPDGIGNLYIAFQQTKERLFNEGLFDSKYKLKPPYIPQGIAVITSPTGAAIRDILSTLARRNPYIPVYVIPTLVQGDLAANKIIDAIKFVEDNCQTFIDVIILARGGGSIEELSAFNDEQLARQIFSCRLPIITGVGHETDTTIADYVADIRAVTPTAAAEIVAPAITDLKKMLELLDYRLITAYKKQLEHKHNKILQAQNILMCYNPLEVVLSQKHNLSQLLNRIKQAIDNRINNAVNEYLLQNQKLDDLNPLKTMKRGYSLVYKEQQTAERQALEQQELIKSVKQINIDDMLQIQLLDGNISCQVRGVTNDKKIV